ncbi:NADP-dependent oxidoreductase [Streptomyces sp. NPDC006798]|uniref:NADP-dependent oxidoreductase n=1 Tax=Streptomyces sp. NPDC006798 TaxID=3155462 RepID=UPI0033EF6EB1
MSALPKTSREWHLVARPHGWPTKDLVELREVPVAELADGRVLVRNTYFSVDPYMRGRMSDAKSYAAPYELDRPMHGGAVGEVIASRAEGFAVGDTVAHQLGWREIADVPAREARKIDTSLAPASAYLSVLGMTGLTAYAGLTKIAGLKEGDTVFVSGAAGAVGGFVGQIARIKGAARVIGSAGSDAKVRRLVEGYGFDAAFNYKNGPVAAQLAEAAPDGIDVYFDNVGGEHLEAALGAFRPKGRAALCGAISVYNATEPAPGPNNLYLAVTKQLRLEGFLVIDHFGLLRQFVTEAAGWLASGELVYDETVVTGIENGFDAFLGVLRGENLGKMLVALP